MKKVYLVLAVLLIAAMALAACQPAEEATQAPAQATDAPAESTEAPAVTEAPAEATEVATEAPAATEAPSADDVYSGVTPAENIIFWHNHSQERQEALQQIVDEFNSTNEWGITVTQEYQGSYGDIFNKMLPILNTPDVPDLVVAYQNQAATYQLDDALVDLNLFVNSPAWGLSEEDQGDFFPGFFQQDVNPSFENKRLGFPPNRSAEVMYYNTSWLTELGFDGPPTTPEQFKEMACAAAQTPFTQATVEGNNGYELSLDASRFASWTFSFGGDIFDYDSNQYTLNSEAAVAAMTFLQDLFNEGCATQVVENYGDQTDFGNGTLLFSIGSSSGLPFYGSAVEEGAGHEWSITTLPATGEPVLNVYGASVSIPKSTPERELAAWLFLKYYTSKEVQATWAQASNYFPVRESVAEGLTDYFAANPTFKTGFDLLQYSHFEPPVPGYDFVRTEIQNAMAAIVEGADVQETLDGLNETANQILEDNLSQISQ
jgi:multiple sugar transport system substrate-binding protein/sn-glycerol 3-phosphate transport system substrate-binding protein